MFFERFDYVEPGTEYSRVCFDMRIHPDSCPVRASFAFDQTSLSQPVADGKFTPILRVKLPLSLLAPNPITSSDL